METLLTQVRRDPCGFGPLRTKVGIAS